MMVFDSDEPITISFYLNLVELKLYCMQVAKRRIPK